MLNGAQSQRRRIALETVISLNTQWQKEGQDDDFELRISLWDRIDILSSSSARHSCEYQLRVLRHHPSQVQTLLPSDVSPGPPTVQTLCYAAASFSFGAAGYDRFDLVKRPRRRGQNRKVYGRWRLQDQSHRSASTKHR